MHAPLFFFQKLAIIAMHACMHNVHFSSPIIIILSLSSRHHPIIGSDKDIIIEWSKKLWSGCHLQIIVYNSCRIITSQHQHQLSVVFYSSSSKLAFRHTHTLSLFFLLSWVYLIIIWNSLLTILACYWGLLCSL